jgi:hypothetical protein
MRGGSVKNSPALGTGFPAFETYMPPLKYDTGFLRSLAYRGIYQLQSALEILNETSLDY